jgi:hypothetical protein
MMTGEEIARISREAASRAQARNMKPYVVWPEDLVDTKRGIIPKGMSIPFLGDYIPKGWEMEEELFVDSSGFGQEDEPSLTMESFVKKMEEGKGYAVTSQGQFQVYVGVYRRVG